MMSRGSKSTHPPLAGFASRFVVVLLLAFHLPSASGVNFNLSNFSGMTNIELAGNASHSPSDDTIQLTKVTYGPIEALYYSTGRAFYSDRIPLWEPTTRRLASFTTTFSFFIGSVRYRNESGDGVAFIIAANGSYIPDGAIGGYLGLFSNDTISPSWGVEAARRRSLVAVEFDSYPNPWDPKHMHLGIDVASIESVAHAYWTEYRTHTINTTVLATVSYDAATKNLSAWMVDGNGNRAAVSYVVDLSEVLPSCVYVGFSAATGLNVEKHQLFSWRFDSDLDHVSSCTAPPGTTVPEETGRPKTTSTRFLLLLGSAAGSGAAWLAVFFLGMGLWWRWRIRRRTSVGLITIREIGPREFRYRELRDATANFSKLRELGRGASGVVYRGTLSDPDATDVAVKKFTRGSAQGREEYIAEVTVISRIRHRSLVKLLGWCHERGEFLLVYEFMPNRSLGHHLFSRQSQPASLQRHNSSTSSDQSSPWSSSSTGVMTWSARYKVAVDLASALHYLHDECEQYVIHRDIKPSNILLDMQLNAKLGDFGLARMVEYGLSMSSAVALAGTPGYVAPECFATLRSTRQSDVYSFGVVAVEIATGRSVTTAMQEQPEKSDGLLGSVWALHEAGKLMEAVDRNLMMEFDQQEMERLLVVGLWCTVRDPTKRPSMGNVLSTLRLEVPLPALPERVSPPEVIYATLNVDTSTPTNDRRRNSINGSVARARTPISPVPDEEACGASSVFSSAVSVYP